MANVAAEWVGRWVVVVSLDVGIQEREECCRVLSHCCDADWLDTGWADVGVISAAKMAVQLRPCSNRNRCNRRRVRYTAKQETWSTVASFQRRGERASKSRAQDGKRRGAASEVETLPNGDGIVIVIKLHHFALASSLAASLPCHVKVPVPALA
jgi:hypothetical protein